MLIRPYEETDHDACRVLWEQLTEHHRRLYIDRSIGGDDPGSGLDTYLADAERVGSWVAVDGEAVVGLTGLLVRGDEGEIEPVVVAENHRSRGVGADLLDRVIGEARDRGLRNLAIRPVARNSAAIDLFHRNGFQILGHLEMFMDLSGQGEWREGMYHIHGLDFRF